MKRFILAALLVLCAALPAVAQESEGEKTPYVWDHGDNVSNLSYRVVPVFKIYDQPDAYVILYEMQGVKVGQTVIPKSWTHETPRRLEFRRLPAGVTTYLTVIYKDGEFYKAILTAPTDRGNSVWGVVPNGHYKTVNEEGPLQIEY